MTPSLMVYVLSLPLKTRLALYDADPKGPGVFGTRGKEGEFSWWESPYVFNHSFPEQLTPEPEFDELRDCIEMGGAWVPDNAITVVEHAAKLRTDKKVLYAMIESQLGGKYYATLKEGEPSVLMRMHGSSSHECAVRLLAEVVRYATEKKEKTA